jgi:hypothetical protein
LLQFSFGDITVGGQRSRSCWSWADKAYTSAPVHNLASQRMKRESEKGKQEQNHSLFGSYFSGALLCLG